MKNETIKILKDTIIQWKKEYDILDSIIDMKDAVIADIRKENKTYKTNADAVQKYITQNEQLKTHIDGLEKKNAALKAENERLKKDKIGLHSEIKQLEQENYGLNQELLGYKKGVQASEIIELKQTLQEIKKIAEQYYPIPITMDFTAIVDNQKSNATLLYEILQLITKAESEKE